MNILRQMIVKQTNGKYALWDDEEQSFDRFNCETPGEILDYLIQRVHGILLSSIASHANDDSQFKMALAEFKDKNGLDTSARDSAGPSYPPFAYR
nr:hypothetical protein [uncultured Desulfobacter sp.]